MSAVIRQDPTVAIAPHEFRIGNGQRTWRLYIATGIVRASRTKLLDFFYTVAELEKVAGKLRSAHR
jgi:hypothetical protein